MSSLLLASALLCALLAPTEAAAWRLPGLSAVWPLGADADAREPPKHSEAASKPASGQPSKHSSLSYQAEVADFQPYAGYGASMDAVSGLPSLRID